MTLLRFVCFLCLLLPGGSQTPNEQLLEEWQSAGSCKTPHNGVITRIDSLPRTLFFKLPSSNGGEVIRFSSSPVQCGGNPSTIFCLQSQPTTSWLGLVSAHFPIGTSPIYYECETDNAVSLFASSAVDLANIRSAGELASMYYEILSPMLVDAPFAGARVKLSFVCEDIFLPEFPRLEANVTTQVIENIPTRLYDLKAYHYCACKSAQEQEEDACLYFASEYNSRDAVHHWYNSAAERQGSVRACIATFTSDLHSLWGLSLAVVLALWCVDVFISWPRLGMTCAERYPSMADATNRCRPGDLAYERPLGSHFYVLSFGWMDILTPPAHLLETDEIAWPTAAGFGAISIVIPAFVNGVIDVPEVLLVFVFFMPLILCRFARSQTTGLIFGAGYSIAALTQIWASLSCFAMRHSPSNVFSLFPAAICVTYCGCWYWWQTAKRLNTQFNRYRGLDSSPVPTWRELQIARFDRRPYIRELLHRVPRAPLSPSLGYRAFKDTLMGANHYMVPTRALSAVLLSICCVLALIPALYSLGGLLGAIAEFFMSSGHCCSGAQCDPTPGAADWVGDWLNMGVGLQLGYGEQCTRDQTVIRNVLRVGIAIASTLIGLALCISLVHTLVVYRKRMLMLFKSQPDFIIKPVPVGESIAAALKYGGTQVASTLAALTLGTIVVTLLEVFITISTIMPIMGFYGDWFWPWWFSFAILNTSTGQLGFLAMMLLNYYTMVLLSRFAFRMDKDDRGLQRRGLFYILDSIEFVFYTFNALLGLIKRAITSIFFQVIFMGRMDKSLMPRKHELWDKSYVSYLGYMQLDLYYSHPVMMTACYFLLMTVEPPPAHSSGDVHPSLAQTSGGGFVRHQGNGTRQGSATVFKTLPNEEQDDVSIESDDGAALTARDTLGHDYQTTAAGAGDEAGDRDRMRKEGSISSTASLHRRIKSDVSVLVDANEEARMRSKRIRNYWWLLITLYNNRSLRRFRAHALTMLTFQTARGRQFFYEDSHDTMKHLESFRRGSVLYRDSESSTSLASAMRGPVEPPAAASDRDRDTRQVDFSAPPSMEMTPLSEQDDAESDMGESTA